MVEYTRGERANEDPLRLSDKPPRLVPQFATCMRDAGGGFCRVRSAQRNYIRCGRDPFNFCCVLSVPRAGLSLNPGMIAGPLIADRLHFAVIIRATKNLSDMICSVFGSYLILDYDTPAAEGGLATQTLQPFFVFWGDRSGIYSDVGRIPTDYFLVTMHQVNFVSVLAVTKLTKRLPGINVRTKGE